jgi:hypothetical protein
LITKKTKEKKTAKKKAAKEADDDDYLSSAGKTHVLKQSLVLINFIQDRRARRTMRTLQRQGVDFLVLKK